jgi:hypothetical protein
MLVFSIHVKLLSWGSRDGKLVRAGAVYFNPGRRRRILICNVPFYGMHSHGVLDFFVGF